ncbi:cation-translocating P-type ATPase [Nonomuraea sp. NPDC049709]|uniref:cation-translocating P-type ATPase n=1 Tax=Nonomuraea sp. NPDC049709 TaxID=3154736 RepID=UPI003429097B
MGTVVALLGLRAPAPVSGAVELATGVAGWLLGGGREARDVWERPGRLHIETHGVHGPGGARVARRVERALERHPGVLWARVNAPACRVVVAVGDPPPLRRELVALVAHAESAPASLEEEVAEEELHHPAEGPERTRVLPNLAVDSAALVLSGLTRVAPWAPLPTELAGLLSAVSLHPRLRELAAERLHGQERAESLVSMAAGLAHAMAAGGSGVVLDVAQRIGEWREARADQQAWQEAEPRLIRGPDDAAADPVVVERPCALPDGPVERYQRRILAAGAAAMPVATPLVGWRRAAAVGLATLPKASEAGRVAFASHLGRVLARNGALVMDRSALRLLGRVDTLLLDDAVLRTGRWELTDLIPLAGADAGEVAEVGFALFAPDGDARAVRRDGEWVLGPVEDLELRGRTGARQRKRLAGTGAEVVLGLARRGRLEAVLAAEQETAPGLDAVVAAARRARLRIVLATDEQRPARGGHADVVVERRRGLSAAVREIQAAGGAVMLISGERRALGAADCGLGVHRDGEVPPWGAHVLVGSELGTAVLLVEAVAAARSVDRDAIVLSQAATGIGAASALQGGSARPSVRSLRAVNIGAALAFADGAWRAHHLHTQTPARAVARTPWHLMPAEAVLRRLDTGEEGLSSEEARQRWRAGGRLEPLGSSLGAAFMEELANPLTPVLAGGAALSAVVGSLVDAGLVAGITGVSALTGAAQRVRTDRALADLLARSAVGATVRRDGIEQIVTAEQLVPGDVVLLGPGDVVPADCRLLRADGVEADESSLTGESLSAAKDVAPVIAAELADRRSMLYEGTTLAAGRAVAVVVATGADTEVGRSMAAARQSAPATGVEQHLRRFTRHSLPVALGSAAAVTGAGLLHSVPVRDSLSAAVNLAIASVPEGLPFLVNAAQLSAARRLADLGALVRNPRTIEALGRVDVLCFDKTGTLTEGRLAVREVHDGTRARPVRSLDDSCRTVVAAALRASPDARHPEDLAHQTDRAVVECARRARIRPGTGARGWRKTLALPFEPSRGFHATLGRAGGQVLLSVKGAPEVVLSRCGRHRTGGREREMTDGDHTALTELAERLAGAGHRVLAVAERRMPATQEGVGEDTVRDLTFLGFLALADPVRTSAAPAAARLHEAGVRTVMITGDHPATADAIAATVHPGATPNHVLTGAEIDELDDAALDKRLPEVNVIARCSPAQKVRIIQAYQRLGKVVAMTGDGANDAPAIRLADVGIALGRRGTPAAQAAADLVVSDDRLETIIAALVEGRAMWSSVRHALGILLGGNLGEIAFTVLGTALTGRSPLNARQLLLVNLLTDLAPALAIALRPPSEHDVAHLLREGPDMSLGEALTQEMYNRALATAAGAGSAWLAARFTGRSRRASTVALAALVGSQLGQTLLTGGLDRNVLAAGLGSAALLTAVIQTPFVSGFFGCTPLGPIGWSIALSSATAGSVLGAALSRWPLDPPGWWPGSD